MNKNLLEETRAVMKENRVAPSDVFYCKTDDANFTWKVFEKAARDFNYDNGFGLPQVRRDLQIVGMNWWMKRREYDGAEWWEFLTRPEAGDTVPTSWISLRERNFW